MYTCVQNDTRLACCNFDARQLVIYFPPHLTNAAALPGKTRTQEIASFHLNAVYFKCWFTKKHKHIQTMGYSASADSLQYGLKVIACQVTVFWETQC